MIILQKVILYTPDPLLVHFMSITEVLIHQKIMEILLFLIPRFLFFWKKTTWRYSSSRDSLLAPMVSQTSSQSPRGSFVHQHCFIIVGKERFFLRSVTKRAITLISSLIHHSIPYHPIVFIPSHHIVHLPRVSGTAIMTKIRAAAQRSA